MNDCNSRKDLHTQVVVTNRVRMIQCVLVPIMLLMSYPVLAVDDGLARTPPMGWNSWNKFHCNITETLIRQTADAMASSGMKDAGYEFVNLDDCWQISRDVEGVIVADPADFPGGISGLADYVHSKGLKLGLYSDHGTLTCAGRPGSYGYETIDAVTYALWGVDYLKYDNCNLAPGSDQQTDYEVMRDALAASGRDIVYSICAWTFKDWMPQTGHLWRTTGDISDNWSSMVSKLDTNNRSAFWAGPGRWNDPDMLEVGNGGMTDTEYRSHFSLWCIAAAPLLAGNDLRSASQATKDILTAPEVIAVDQDPAGIQGIRLSSIAGTDGNLEIWSKPIEDTFTTRAVALFNRSSQAADISVAWNAIGLAPGNAVVRDLWTRTDLGVFAGSYTANVPPHGTKLVKITGASPPAVYVSDQHFHSADNGFGSVERDKSNGESGPYDGRTIALNGMTYDKGLGVHAPSRLQCHLGGRVWRFKSDIGVDDEVGQVGSVVFRVWDGSTLLYDSGVMTPASATKSIDLDVTGKTVLTLEVTDAGDGKNYDHADWANARLVVAPPYTLSSPDGGIQAAVKVIDGDLYYNMTRRGEIIIDDSRLGPILDQNGTPLDLGADILLVSAEPISTINRLYSTVGWHTTAIDYHNELTLSMVRNDSINNHMVQLRAFNDGLAFRYILPAGGGNRTVLGEATEWKLPADTVGWYQSGFNADYANWWVSNTIANLAVEDRLLGPIILEHPGGGFTAISESDYWDYSGMTYIGAGSGTNTIRAAFIRDTAGWQVPAGSATPWRTIITVNDLTALVNSDLINNVARPADSTLFPDGVSTSWIEPGRAMWSWLDINGAGINPTNMRAYIAKAAELDFEYVTIDSGWKNWSDPFTTVQTLADEAAAVGVELFVWKDSHDFYNTTTGQFDHAAMETFLQQVKDAHAAGVKMDFLRQTGHLVGEYQRLLNFMAAAYEAAAERQMIVNFHGAPKPAGTSITFPNALTSEHLRGLESGANTAHDAALPFTTLIAGPADYTPGLFSPDSNRGKRANTTWTHQMAMGIVITSPIIHWTSGPQLLDAAAPAGSDQLEVFQSIPAVWDETIVLDISDIGTLAAFARRKDDRWFLAMVGGDASNSMTINDIDLSFLGTETWEAILIADDAAVDAAFNVSRLPGITASSDLTVTMRRGGGFVAMFVPPTSCRLTMPLQTTVSGYLDGGNPPDAAIRIENTGSAGYPTSYTVTELNENHVPADVAWLSVDKLSGGPIPGGQTDTMTLHFDIAGLALGTYTAFLQFTDSCTPATTTLHSVTLAINVPPGSTAACYSFDDGTANDSSGNGNHGTLVNGASIINDADRGGVLNLDGSDDYVNLGNGSSLNLSDAGQATLAAWVKPAVTKNHNSIITKGEWKQAYSLLIKGDTTPQNLLWTGNDTSVFSGAAIPVGVWTHAAVVIDGHLTTFYINGQPSGSINQNRGGPIDSTGTNVCIGREQYSGSLPAGRWFFNGRIDDVRIYPAALCADEIQRLFSGNPPGDVDGDGSVTLADFSYMSQQWLSDGSHVPTADITPVCGDGAVNMDDLIMMVNHYLEL